MSDNNRIDVFPKQDEYTPGLNEIAQPLNSCQNDLEAPTPYMQSINLPGNQSQPQYSSQNETEYQSQPQYPNEIKPPEYQPLPVPQSQQAITIQPGIQYQPQNQYNKQIPITNIQNENSYHQTNNLINDNSKATKNRLKCQIAMVILLFITVPISLALQIFGNFISIITSVDDILIIINVIWILYYTKNGQNSRNNKIGIYTLASLFIGMFSRGIVKYQANSRKDILAFWYLLLTYIFFLRIAVAIGSFKCLGSDQCT